jgi:hypothetical protein
MEVMMEAMGVVACMGVRYVRERGRTWCQCV